MRQTCALLLAFALGATPAFADDPPAYEPKFIPKCTLYPVPGKGEVCGYTLEEWKIALAVDAELVHVKDRLNKEEQRTAILDLQVKNLEIQVAKCADSQKSLVEYTESCTTDRIKCDKDLQNERVKPRLGSPVAWTIAGVAVAVLGGILLKDLVD